MNGEVDIRLEAIYRAHAREVHAYCLRRTSREEAKDATSDVFLVAWRRIEEVPAGDEALPWLLGVALNVLANRSRSFRRRGRLVAKASQFYDDEAPGPEPLLVRREEHRQLAAALAALPERDQEILRLVEWEGLSRQEVAEMLFLSKAAIDKRMARAYKKMARTLGVPTTDAMKTPVTLEEGGEA